MAEKVFLLGQIFEIKFLMKLHILRSSEFENHIFRGWSVCEAISTAEKQIVSDSSNLVF